MKCHNGQKFSTRELRGKSHNGHLFPIFNRHTMSLGDKSMSKVIRHIIITMSTVAVQIDSACLNQFNRCFGNEMLQTKQKLNKNKGQR